jgi:hypothetical protein
MSHTIRQENFELTTSAASRCWCGVDDHRRALPQGDRGKTKFDPLDNPAQGEVPVLHSFGSFTATDVARSRQFVPNSTVSSTVPPLQG